MATRSECLIRRSRLSFIWVLAIGVMLVAAACDGEMPASSDTGIVTGPDRVETTSRQEAPPITGIEGPPELSWSPLHRPGAELSDRIMSLLSEFGTWTIWPVQPPVGDPSNSSARLWITETIPTGIVTVHMDIDTTEFGMAVRSLDQSVIPRCADRLATQGDAEGWGPLQVRGVDGCFQIVSGGVPRLVIEWREGDRAFQVQSHGLDSAVVTGWLARWSDHPPK